VNLQWLAEGEMTRYLGFMIGFRIAREARFETVLNALRKKLTFWATTHLSLAGRVLIANQVFLASIWYVASCWCPQVCTMNKVKALVRNYIWSGENRKKQCRVKVAWDTMILPKEEIPDPTPGQYAQLKMRREVAMTHTFYPFRQQDERFGF
jgi:hypothetical protein